MSITPQDIATAIEKMSNAWKLVRSLEDLSDSLQTQLRGQLDTLVYSKEELESLQSQLVTAQEQKEKLLAEITGLNQQIISLQKELESRPPKEDPKPVEPKPEPEPDKTLATIPFTIKDTTGQGRSAGEYAFTAIPLAQSLNVKDVDQLRVVAFKADDSLAVVPESNIIIADIRPTAYWTDGSIQWVQVVFAVGAFTDSTQCELLVYEKPQPLPVSQIYAEKTAGFSVRVKSGGREYIVSVAGVFLAGRLDSSGIKAIFDGKESSSSTIRDIYIEYLGTHVCYIVVEGLTDLNFSTYTDKQGKSKPAPISFRRRYQFLANNPLVTVQETIRWEGSYNGTNHERNQPEKPYGQRDPNALLGVLWRESFSLKSDPLEISILDDIDDPSFGVITNPIPVGNILLEQRLRVQRLNAQKTAVSPLTYRAVSGGLTVQGSEASGGMLSVKTKNSQYITVAIKDMHLHEPQAISLAGNEIQLDLSSDKFWLPHHSGVEVTYAIHVDDKQPDLNSIWRQVNKPLRGLCQAEQYNESGGFNCLGGGIMIPTGKFGIFSSLESYDLRMKETVQTTLDKMSSYGFQGLMTWGLYPRYWAEWGFNSGEIGSGVGGWDEFLRNGSFTDYWCTSKLALEWAIRSGESERIEQLTIPAAVRMLHTQIMQAAPDDSYFYAGQAPAGYSMYRSDMNSSHQYWENLYLYYLITGDRTVIDVIERGAFNQINYMNDKKGVVGRQPMQWLQAYLFLSHCHYTEGNRLTFGRAFDMFMKQAIQNHYLEGYYQGEREAIWTQKPVSSPLTDKVMGVYESHQLFSLCFYDMEMLYQFGLRTNNEFVNGARPFDMMVNIAKTIIRRGIGSDHKNVETSAWLRLFSVDYDGKGKFTRFEGGVVDPQIVNGQIVGGQRILFPDDKGTMLTFFSRCAWLSNDSQIKQVSRDLVKLMFKQIAGRGLPFGKLIGMLMSRLSAAVAVEQMIEKGRDQQKKGGL